MSDLDDVDDVADDFDGSEDIIETEVSVKQDLKELQQRKLALRRKVEEQIELKRIREELGDSDFNYDYV